MTLAPDRAFCRIFFFFFFLNQKVLMFFIVLHEIIFCEIFEVLLMSTHNQSCGNTMPDLSNLSHFPEDK